MNQFGNTVSAWLPLIVFQQVESPRYHKGWITLTAVNSALIISTLVTWQLQKREDAKRAVVEDSNDGTEDTSLDVIPVTAGKMF
jgi:ACS family pantothenate transporter-like MFS transporter